MMSSDEDVSDVHENAGFWGEDGEWHERRDHQHTKADHIYGVFADTYGRKLPPKHAASFHQHQHQHQHHEQPHSGTVDNTLHFNFIKGGVQTTKEEKEDETGSTTTNSTTATKTGDIDGGDQQSILEEWEKIKQQKKQLSQARRTPSLGTHGLPTQLGARGHTKSSMQPQPKSNVGVKLDTGYAKWTSTEKRDKFGGLSFAERYLQKHGFKGRLGKSEQGIANPVKHASTRKNNEGLGFGDKDGQQTQSQPKNVDQELRQIKRRTEAAKQNIDEQQKLWKLIDEHHEMDGEGDDEYDVHDEAYLQQPMKKRKIAYQTASEFIKQQREQQGQHSNSKMTIHDYTQTQVSITTTDQIDSNAVPQQQVQNGCRIDTALKHNVDVICTQLEEKREILARERNNLEQQLHSTKLQLNEMTKLRSKRNERDSVLQGLKQLLRKLDDEHEPEQLTVAQVLSVFAEIQRRFFTEYLRYRLWRLYSTVLFPKLKRMVNEWQLELDDDDNDDGEAEVEAVESVEWMRLLRQCRPLMSNEYMHRTRKLRNHQVQRPASPSPSQDVYAVLADKVVVPKIRSEFYKWDPLNAHINTKFARWFAALRPLLPCPVFQSLLKHIVVPHLNCIMEQTEHVMEETLTQCIFAWQFMLEFSDDGDDVLDSLGKTIAKKMKRFCKTLDVGSCSEQQHLICIEALLAWKPFLTRLRADHAGKENVFSMLKRSVITKKLQQLLNTSVLSLDVDRMQTMQQMALAHLWYIHDIFCTAEYIELLQSSFCEPWISFLYHRLNDEKQEEDVSRSSQIEHVWNDFYAILKNELFKSEHSQIAALLRHPNIEKYLTCALHMMHWNLTQREALPSFDVIQGEMVHTFTELKIETHGQSKSKKKQKTSARSNAAKASSSLVSDDAVETIGLMELMEMKAQEHNIEFYLDGNKTKDSKKLYRFGRLQVYFTDNVIFAKKDDMWKAMDIGDLIRQC